MMTTSPPDSWTPATKSLWGTPTATRKTYVCAAAVHCVAYIGAGQCPPPSRQVPLYEFLSGATHVFQVTPCGHMCSRHLPHVATRVSGLVLPRNPLSPLSLSLNYPTYRWNGILTSERLIACPFPTEQARVQLRRGRLLLLHV